MPDWERLKEIFHAALLLPPQDRPAYLEQACDGDTLLQQSVESLLKSHEESGFVDEPAYAAAANLLIEDQRLEQSRDGTLQPGDAIGRYCINSLLGEGGMGRVYLAEDTKLYRKVSLKFLSKAVTSDHEKLLRFEQEARAASALNHPNILTIYEFGEAEDQQFIATEYIQGQTLRERLQRPVELDEALEISIQVASALVAAHRVNIVHRDIKPDNIIIRKDDGLVKVLDFGLAKIVAPRTPEAMSVNGEAPTRFKTGPGVVMGTVAYMSPEQARGDTIDERADIWSLGIVLFEMIAGSTPFVAETSNEILSGILSQHPAPPLTRFSHDLPERLQEIVDKALTKNRDQRYQTSKDLLIDLKRLKQSLELKAGLDRNSAPETVRPIAKASETQSKRVAVPTGYPTSSAEYVVNQIRSHKRGVIAGAAFLIVAAAGLVIAGISIYRPRQTVVTSAPAIDSIAVLPFVNANADPETEYLCDGLAESVINRLSQLPTLKVMSRNSAFRYKGRDADATAVGRELNVQAVLTGHVAQRGNALSINLELVNVVDGVHLWGEQYERMFADLPTIQREIALDVSEKLRLRLTSAEKQRLTKRYTDNAEAYRLYLKGRYFWDKRNRDGMENAIKNYNEAIALDPDYALAYAGLADCYLFPQHVGETPHATIPKSRALATKALELDDTLAEAHTTLAFIKMRYDYDWAGAEQEFKQSIDLNPNYPVTHQFYGTFLVNTGKTDQGLREINRALELDPLSVTINWSLGLNLYHARRYDEAITQFQKILQMDASHELTHLSLAAAYIQKGMYTGAIITLRDLDALRKDSPRVEAKFSLAYVYAVSGRREEALRMLDELKIKPEQDDFGSFHTAKIYAALGEREQALAWLNRAYENRDFNVIFLKVDPTLDALRDDPRLQDLMRRVGLPQ